MGQQVQPQQVQSQQVQPWRSADGERLWLSMLVDTMEQVSRPEIRSGPCEISIVGLPPVGIVWMLCIVPSELRNSTDPPRITAITCGVYLSPAKASVLTNLSKTGWSPGCHLA